MKIKKYVLGVFWVMILTMLPSFCAFAGEEKSTELSFLVPGLTVTCPEHGSVIVETGGTRVTKGPGTYGFTAVDEPAGVSVTAVPEEGYEAAISCRYPGEYSISADQKTITFTGMKGVADVRISFREIKRSSDEDETAGQVYRCPCTGVSAADGAWTKTGDIWTCTVNGSMARNGWYFISNPYSRTAKNGWFCFDKDGRMLTGWVLSDGKWYFCHDAEDGDLGKMQTGWHFDSQDGHAYYLDPVTGAMATGWKLIGGKWYFFCETSMGSSWRWDGMKWVADPGAIRPLGSLLTDTETPDGHRVDDKGARID